MSVPPRSLNRSSEDGGFLVVFILIGVGVLALVAWLNWSRQISAAAIAVFQAQIALLQPFTDRFDVAAEQMAVADPARVRIGHLVGMARAIGSYVAWPLAAATAALGVLCVLRTPQARFRRGFDLEGLAREHARSFPVASAFLGRRLRLVAPAAPPAESDPALGVEEWVAVHASGPNGIDRDAAATALAAQLGPVWPGVERVQGVPALLCLAFSRHRAGDREGALALLGAASVVLGEFRARSSPEQRLGRLTLEAALELREARHVAVLRSLEARHRYTSTLLMSLLVEARRASGVLPPAAFAWLRLSHRPLWYALSSLGFDGTHPNPRVEALGARDHWAVECALERRILEPQVDRAVDALHAACAVRTPSRETARVTAEQYHAV